MAVETLELNIASLTLDRPVRLKTNLRVVVVDRGVRRFGDVVDTFEVS